MGSVGIGIVWNGSRGEDLMGVVGYGEAGSSPRIGRVMSGTERWGLAVQVLRGSDECGGVRSGSRGGDWNDARGLVRWGKAV